MCAHLSIQRKKSIVVVYLSLLVHQRASFALSTNTRKLNSLGFAVLVLEQLQTTVQNADLSIPDFVPPTKIL